MKGVLDKKRPGAPAALPPLRPYHLPSANSTLCQITVDPGKRCQVDHCLFKEAPYDIFGVPG